MLIYHGRMIPWVSCMSGL